MSNMRYPEMHIARCTLRDSPGSNSPIIAANICRPLSYIGREYHKKSIALEQPASPVQIVTRAAAAELDMLT
jgi:hypothetical protein